MVKQILEHAGFVEDVSYRETRFLKPPALPYCVYLDEVIVSGSDGLNDIKEHLYSIELYSTHAEREKERLMEEYMDANGIRYTKMSRTWLETEKMYMTVYNFDILRKEL